MGKLIERLLLSAVLLSYIVMFMVFTTNREYVLLFVIAFNLYLISMVLHIKYTKEEKQNGN